VRAACLQAGLQIEAVRLCQTQAAAAAAWSRAMSPAADWFGDRHIFGLSNTKGGPLQSLGLPPAQQTPAAKATGRRPLLMALHGQMIAEYVKGQAWFPAGVLG